MDKPNNDIERFYKQSSSEAPPVAIALCVGRNGITAPEHHPFVIIRKATEGKGLWENDSLAECDSLDEALKYNHAQPYGTSTTCTPCRRLP